MTEPLPIKSSFYWAMRLMPRERREAMYALYRYCRALDDIADGPGSADDKLARLTDWRRSLDGLFRGDDPGIPEIRGLADALGRYGLEQEPLDAIIRGMEMDVRGEMRAPSLNTLQRYCYCVAGAVGLASLRIFGAGDQGRTFAIALGEALQLTNILRDLAEDAAQSRLYLPREFLRRANIDTDDPRAALEHPAMNEAFELLGKLAAQRYRDAVAAQPRDIRPLRPAMIMMSVYGALLDRLRRSGWPAAQAETLPKSVRLWIALRHLGPPSTWPSSI